LNALILVITLILTFWLVALVWSLKVAKRVFQIIIYFALIFVVISGIYVGYQSYRWGSLLHELNERSFNATAILNSPPPAPVVNQN